jgi:transcriptional regulator with XRE-family HTH domain
MTYHIVKGVELMAKKVDPELIIKIGSVIKEYRSSQNIKIKELAEKLDVSDRYLIEVEAGRKCLSLSLLVQAAQILNISLDAILLCSDKDDSQDVVLNSLINILKKSDSRKLRIFNDIIISLDKNLDQS